MANQILLPVLLLGMISRVTPQDSGPLYPILGTESSRALDGSSPRIILQRPFVYFGQSYNQIYVNHNGHLTFDISWGSYSPQPFPMYGSIDIIAPFWTDLDNRVTGHVYYNQYTNGSVLQQATADINEYFPGLNFNAAWVFVATWYEVAYFPTTGTRTTFQAVLISGGQYSFVLMNYGVIASTSHPVQAGYDTVGSPHYYIINGSFSSNATGSNSAFSLGSNVNVTGRWAFQIDNGSRSCTFNGQAMQLGDSYWRGSTCSQKCTCSFGGLQCYSQPCSFSQICRPALFQYSCQTLERGTCTINGGSLYNMGRPQYYTFDRTFFHFQGTCTYVLSEQCNMGMPYYRIEGKNEHRGSTHAFLTRLVKVYVYNETIELVKGHYGEAKVNGNFAATPFSLSNGTIQVYESGFFVVVSTDFGLLVSYDSNHYVRISVPYTYQNATCGLCGNFNNHPQDDFRTRDGKLVDSNVVFANSWQGLDDEPGCVAQCAGQDCAECSELQISLYSNAAHCGILQSSSGPFAACHQQLPPQTIVENCVFDLCIGGGYQPILCQALNVYASQCQQNGIQLPSWREPGFCGHLYPILGTESSRTLDGSSPRIILTRSFVYFGQSYHQIYVNHNGHLTFNASWSSYIPQLFPMNGPRDIIAPFWTDIDHRVTGHVYFNQYTNGSVLQQATADINEYFPGLNFNAAWVFVATWYQVAYYPTTGTRTTFQAVLISGGQYSFVLMNYGVIASTSHPVQAGYDTVGSPHYYIIPGSFSSNATGSNSAFSLGSNVNVTGRWAFRTDNGSRGCTFNGQAVQLGDSFWSDSTCSQKCTCTSTGLQCHSQPCSFFQVCRPSSFQYSCQRVRRRTCTISGGPLYNMGRPNYHTFDRTSFQFQGTCTYVLSEQCNMGMPYYRIEGKNEHRGSTHAFLTRLVKVYVYNETIELVKGHHGEAKVNGNFAATPFSLSNGTIQVYESGFSVVVSTDFGLLVSYESNFYVRVMISVPDTYQNATCGLCGNFNNHPQDDFRTRDGELVDSDVVFANSWQGLDDEPGCEAQCVGQDCAACSQLQRSLYSDAAHCGILQSSSGPFAACHQQLPPQTIVENCVFDLCIGEGYQPILCQALNVYASQCQQKGIQLPSWREPGFCEIPCPANSHFESAGTGCPPTCVNPTANQNCPLPNQESCVCDPGYILSGGVCVPYAECGCSFEGLYYRSGETVILGDDCERRCTCSHGFMSCQSHGCGPLESCSVKEGVRGCRPNSYSTCWIRGPGSYHTFDGLTYQYPGACRLTLSRVMGPSSHPHFVVTAEKESRGQQGFASMVKFEAQGTQVSIEMSNSSNVKVNGQLIRLPFSSGSNSIRIYHSNIHSIIIKTSFGVTVQTVWPHFVRITAPGVYSGSLGGFCGDYDGLPDDDFRTPNGILVNSSQEFGDSWRDGSLAADCVENTNRNPPTTNYNSSEYCGIISSPHGPFEPCWATVDPLEQVDACVDILTGSSDPASTLCEVLRDYALMCQQNSVSLGQWRNAAGCVQTCPLNSHYELCGSSCPSACPSLSFPFPCDTQCQDGCQCDDGFVLNGNQCVPPTACGCSHQGRYRQSGEQFWDSELCQSFCTCNGTTGLVHCTPSSCGPQESCRVVEGEFGCHPSPHGTCSASGDPHYFTFDGMAYDFQGTCRYVLATACNVTGGLREFSVEAKNEPWFGLPVSITADVFVNVWGYQVHMSRGRSGMVEVNGVTRNLPVLLNGSLVSVYASGFQTVVRADFGLSVMYDGSSTVSISVPSNYRGQTCGLCGNFNGNPNDEFRTPSGATVTGPHEFGSAWKVPGNYTCSDGCGSSCPLCTDEGPARAQCQVIRAADGPFSFCHEQVDPTPYFSDCVFDVCVSGNQGQDLLCRAIETYISACQSANVRIYPWRQNTTCRLDCPANSHYELCGTDCGHTCAHSTDATCEQVCSEGCFCDEGFRRSGSGCVSVESCGCQYDGFYYNDGETFWTDGCSQRCECHAPNDLRCSATSCTPAQECTIRNGQLGCFDALSTCTVWGDPHYVTFDGALAHFQGTCSYTITESVSHGTNETQFRVIATNNHRGNNRVSFVSAVDIYLSNQPESVYVRIGPNKRVKVNDVEASLPIAAGTLAQVMTQGSYIVVDANDIKVQFDGRSTLLVRVDQNRGNRVTGMCGNFNGDSQDDKVLRNGTLAQDDNDFGDSWKASTSQPGCGSTDERSGGLSDCTFVEEYSELCSIITNTSGPFSACHLHSDPQPFFSSCVYDLCLYTPANGMLCSAVTAYEKTCSVTGLIPAWRSALHCADADSDPCEQLNCTEYEWCGEKNGVYGCFCDENHHRPNNESYDSSISCVSSSGTMSVSRCQLFEAGFHTDALHLRDDSCKGTLQDGRLVFHFDNDDQLCGTTLRSNGTHFMYENAILGQVDPHGSLISRRRKINLLFSCEYPLTQAISMSVGISPIESIVRKKLPSGQGRYNIRMIPYEDAGFRFSLASSNNSNINMDVDQMLYVEVRTDGIDLHQISTILDSCWATPVNTDYPVRWDLITAECPNPADGTVELIQNGISTAARFSFRMFTFTNFTTIYLHCQVHLCLLSNNDCTAYCYPGYHGRVKRDVKPENTAAISLGPLVMSPHSRTGREIRMSSSASCHLTAMVTLLISLLTAKTLI